MEQVAIQRWTCEEDCLSKESFTTVREPIYPTFSPTCLSCSHPRPPVSMRWLAAPAFHEEEVGARRR